MDYKSYDELRPCSDLAISIATRDVLKKPDGLGDHNAVSFFFKTSFGACSARLDTKTFASHSLHCPNISIRSNCAPELVGMIKNSSAALGPLNFQDGR